MANTVGAEPTDEVHAISRLRRMVIHGVFAVAGLALACNLGAMVVPFFNMQIFNQVLPTRDLATLGALGVGLGISLLVWVALDVLRGAALEALASRFASRLALPVIQSSAFAPRPDLAAGESLADLETVRSFLASPACVAPFDIAWAPVLLLFLMTLHWGLALNGLLCVVILASLNVLGDAVSRRAILAANRATATAMRGAADGVNAAEAVLALGMLPVLARRWNDAQRRAATLVHRALLRARAVAAATSALRMSMTGATVALGLILALNGLASSGSMVAANMILARLLLPFQSLAATRRQWVDALAAWQRLRSVLEQGAPRRYADPLPAPSPRLVVENVFHMPAGAERPLLRGISFAVEPGETLAIIGPSSSGKSTLLRLIAGMAAPNSGGVFLDGTNTYLWEREDFARHVGFVPQRPSLLEESVADNIARMADPDLPSVVRAAKRAGLHRVVAALPDGYATAVRGGILSGGQRQRLALARALYGAPKLLLLDEPTAFLDEAGEAEFVRILGTLRRDGVTVVLVTHRPSLLRTADKVLVLKEGAAVQFGPAAEISSSVVRRPFRLVSTRPERVAAQ